MDSPVDIFDLLLAPFYLAIAFFFARNISNRYIRQKPYYKYLVPGLMCKFIGGISLCLVYTYYYTVGGDVTNYFISANAFVNVLYDGDLRKFFEMLDYKNHNISSTLGSNNIYDSIQFSSSDYYALFTVTLIIPFCILGCKSFICTTILLCCVSFIGMWKLYLVFIDQFPSLTRQFAIAIFFIPSVFFWGSGILKDTYALSAIGFFVFGLYRFQILKMRNIKYLLQIIFPVLIFVFVKPYFFFALLPGSLIWIFFSRLNKMKNKIFKVMVVPFLLLSLIGVIMFSLQYLGQYLGEYNLDNILNKAVKTQQDLIREVQYGGNSYNIGVFEPTIGGIASKIPAALNMAFFRPYIWDARNPVMLLSGLENLFMLGFSLYILFKVKFSTLFTSLFSNPLLIFSFLFALFFAFSVGLTTANYGALARLKIPCIPFYISSLFILYYLNKESFKRR
ncbi:MAG: hypothetical protein HYX39_06615 [Bacteroidetes bacterium]|nr:hypothetical protein [Bacteroidota bacterium]